VHWLREKANGMVLSVICVELQISWVLNMSTEGMGERGAGIYGAESLPRHQRANVWLIIMVSA